MGESFVLVGGGLAAARAAETLRAEGFGGRLVLVGREGRHPYERPPLSKDYLAGKADAHSLLALDESWYAEHDVELRLHAPAVGIDTESHHVTLASGALLAYDRLLVATGSTPRALPVAGGELAGVLSLRTQADADHLAAAMQDLAAGSPAHDGAGRVVILGSGWIALEVAAVARARGLDVTVVGRSTVPLAGVLGRELGGFFLDVHRREGVRFVPDAEPVAVTGRDGRVDGVRLTTGEHLAADLVLVAIGAVPSTHLAEDAGLALDPTTGGIGVGPSLRASDPDVWAAGDVASVPSERYGRTLRIEHWARADDQGRHAARAMLGSTDPYTALPFFFTDQYELGMEYTGHVAAPDDAELVVSGSLDDGAASRAVVFWLEDDRVAAGMALNVRDRTPEVAALVERPGPVDRDALRGFVG